MRATLKWGLSVGAVALMLSTSLIAIKQVVTSPVVDNEPPKPELPKAIDDLFEHLILNQQATDDYNASKLQESCTELSRCQPYQTLFTRYLSFKEALLELQQTIAHLPLSSQLKELIDFQRHYFSDAEIRLLFADDNDLQRFTIAKLEITQDDNLSEELKQQLLANLTTSQPEHITQALLPSKHLNSLNNQFKQAIITKDYNQLAGEFGDAAATRLIALEKRKQQWQSISKQLVEEIKQLKQRYENEQLDKQVSMLLDKHLTPNQQKRFLALNSQ